MPGKMDVIGPHVGPKQLQMPMIWPYIQVLTHPPMMAIVISVALSAALVLY